MGRRVFNFNWRMLGNTPQSWGILPLRAVLVATFLVLLALFFIFPFSGARGSPLIQFVTPTLPPPTNQPPVATAAFDPIDVERNEGTFVIIATATDPDGNLDSVIAVIETPSVSGLDIELKVEDQVKLEFDLKENNLGIKGPDPQAILEQIQQLGGLLVQSGQIVMIELHEEVEKAEFKYEDDGDLKIEAAQVILRVIGTDTEGDSDAATASPNFTPPEDNQDDEKKKKRNGNDD